MGTSSSRIFIKILFQELSQYMGLPKLNQRLQEDTMQVFFEGLFPKDNPKNTRFAINFFTSIGLGGLTDALREFLKTGKAKEAASDAESESSDSSDSDSSDSSDSDSDSAPEDIEAVFRKMQKGNVKEEAKSVSRSPSRNRSRSRSPSQRKRRRSNERKKSKDETERRRRRDDESDN